MVVVLPRPIGADEAENLAALDGEADAIHGGKVAEAAGEITRDNDRVALDLIAGRDFQLFMARPHLFGQQCDESVFDVPGICPRLKVRGRADRQDPPIIHGDELVEARGLFHVGGGDDHAHAGAPRTNTFDQFPELATRQRIDAGRGLVEDEKVRIVDQRAAQAELLPHAAGELFRRTIGKLREPCALQKLGNPPFAFGPRLSENTREELDVLADAEVRIEILPEPLRHVGDAGTDRGAVRRIGDIAAKNEHRACLKPPGASDNAKQRRLADAVGADQSDYAGGRQRYRHIIESGDSAIALADVFKLRDGHC